ncbi:hypothetical protein BS17DRAFT_784821, partial [Gyrodon lividus]
MTRKLTKRLLPELCSLTSTAHPRLGFDLITAPRSRDESKRLAPLNINSSFSQQMFTNTRVETNYYATWYPHWSTLIRAAQCCIKSLAAVAKRHPGST